MPNTALANMTAASSLGGTELFYSVQGSSDVKVTTTQLTSAIVSAAITQISTSGLAISQSSPVQYIVGLSATSANAAGVDPQFSNVQGLSIDFASDDGDNSYGGGTNAKTTLVPLNLTHTAHAAGQIFVQLNRLIAYGMGDSFLKSEFVDYATGPIAGDEGQGFTSVCAFNQQQHLTLFTVTAVTKTTLNTTTTQIIVGSKTVQTVTVASTVGANPGDWIVVERQAPTGFPNVEAVQITAVGAGTISGIFRNNHANGVTVTPALVLSIDNMSEVGQGRVVVNLSGASYSVGTVTGSVGAGLNGGGTAWANNMVGGDALNIGAIQLDKDNYTGIPFNGGGANGTLKSWFQIESVGAANFLNIFSFTVAGAVTYKGVGSFPTTYTIRPSVQILEIVRSSNQIVCETTTTTWNVGDSCEQVICPYPDVTLFTYNTANFTPGGTYRGLFSLGVLGGRKFDTGFSVNCTPDGTNGADLGGVVSAFSVGGGADVGFVVNTPIYSAAIRLRGDNEKASRIDWAGSPQFLQNNNLSGMDWNTVGGLGGTTRYTGQGSINTAAPSSSVVPNLGWFNWNGAIQATGVHNVAMPFYRLDNGSGTTVDWQMRSDVGGTILNGVGVECIVAGSSIVPFAINNAGFGSAGTVQTTQTTVTLINGDNNDINITGSFAKITGPSSAFAVTGFQGPLVPAGPSTSGDGTILRLYNPTSQTMTIKNLTASTNFRQIRTLTGADVVLRASATSFATFIYDVNDASGTGKWILTATN